MIRRLSAVGPLLGWRLLAAWAAVWLLGLIVLPFAPFVLLALELRDRRRDRRRRRRRPGYLGQRAGKPW